MYDRVPAFNRLTICGERRALTLDNAKVNEEVPIAKREKISVSPRTNLKGKLLHAVDVEKRKKERKKETVF